jgi:hypothetical protein
MNGFRKLKLLLYFLHEARKLYGEISPICDMNGECSWSDCLTEDDKYYRFWFNTKDNSTHVLKKEKK